MKVLAGALALALAGCTVALAQDVSPAAAVWQPVGDETGQVRDLAGLQQLAAAFPDSGSVRLRLVNAQLEAGDAEEALETLRWLNTRGHVFGEVARQQIPELVGEGHADEARALLIPTAEEISNSAVVDVTPPEAGLVESVVRDPLERRVIVTSVSARAVMARRMPGKWESYAPEDVANLSGMAMDPDSRMIWIAAGKIDGSDSEGGFAGLIGLDQETGQEIRLPAPAGVALSDITLVDGATIYASDPIGAGVYVANRRDEEVRELVPPGTFRSPQGLAVSRDGAKLYVSDYRYGIAIVDLATRQVSRLASDVPITLDGVDGMWRHENELIVVQNGTSPMRVAALELSDDGMRVTGRRILEQANPEWTEPLSGSLDGDALLYVGNGQWDRFVKGKPASDKPAQPTQIRRLPIR